MRQQENISRRKIWTEKRLAELREFCEIGMKSKIIAHRMNLDHRQIANAMSYYKISNGRSGFQKGVNNVVHRRFWPKHIKHSGSFKPGHKPAHTAPDGARRKTNKNSFQIKHQGQWIGINKFVWEQANGPLPAGYVARTIDPGKEVTIDNLELITMKENLRRNLNVKKRAATQSKLRKLGKEPFREEIPWYMEKCKLKYPNL